jgi:ABC-type antimicrobial peptide transport system permease subunit
LFVAALGGGLGTEIVRTIYFALADMPGYVPAYRHALIVSLGSVCVVLAAMIAGYLLQKLTRSEKEKS